MLVDLQGGKYKGPKINGFKWGGIPSRELTYPTLKKENHLQNGLFRGYVSSLEGITLLKGGSFHPIYLQVVFWTHLEGINVFFLWLMHAH